MLAHHIDCVMFGIWINVSHKGCRVCCQNCTKHWITSIGALMKMFWPNYWSESYYQENGPESLIHWWPEYDYINLGHDNMNFKGLTILQMRHLTSWHDIFCWCGTPTLFSTSAVAIHPPTLFFNLFSPPPLLLKISPLFSLIPPLPLASLLAAPTQFLISSLSFHP